ncbi:MAG: hypothetical protein R2751_18985 [Bacteroidales bacterium]
MNTKFDVTDWMEFGFNLTLPTARTSTPDRGQFWTREPVVQCIAGLAHHVPYQNEDGTLPLEAWLPGSGGFPLARTITGPLREIKHDNRDLRLLSNAYIALRPLKGLTLKSTINLQMQQGNSRDWNPSTSFAGFAAAPPVTASLDLGTPT